MSPIVVFALSSFASGFANRLADPIVLPVARQFAIAPSTAALLNVAFALPYAAAQPFLGPLGDRLGKDRCIQVCVAGLALALCASVAATSFAFLIATRVVAGLFAAGLTPLVLAALGDRYALHERQVMIGRMLFAIIAGQMLGSAVSGLANDAWGWRSPLAIGAAFTVAAAVASIAGFKAARPQPSDEPQTSALGMYAEILRNRQALWLYGCAAVEGALYFGIFPFMGQLLVQHTGASTVDAARETGIVLGATGVGGLVYAMTVRTMMKRLGPTRMSLVGSTATGLCFLVLAFAGTWWLCLLAMTVAGLTFFMMHNSLQTQATELAPSARASAVALFACGFFCGQGLGPLWFGLLSRETGFTAAFVICAAGWLVLGRVVARKVLRAPEPPLVHQAG